MNIVGSIEMRCPKCNSTLEHVVLEGPEGQLFVRCRYHKCRNVWSFEGKVVQRKSVYASVGRHEAVKAAMTPPSKASTNEVEPAEVPKTYTDLMRKVFDDHIRPLKQDYRERLVQLQLAGQVYATLRKARILLAEAGVGTGKTFAYLAPLFYTQHRGRTLTHPGPMIISTKTINLIDQMVLKDVPFVQKAFAQDTVFERRYTRVSVLKGQRHFVCLRRLYAVKTGVIDRGRRQELFSWAEETKTGDRAEEVPRSLTDQQWHMINVDSCDPDTCRHRQECPFLKTRQSVREQVDGVIITNHNLLAEHLARVQRRRDGLWVTQAAVIVDEAHALESSFRQQLSMSLSRRTFEQLIQYLENNSETLDYLVDVDVDSLIPLSEAFFKTLWASRETDDELDDGPRRCAVELTDDLLEAVRKLRSLVEDLSAACESSLNNLGYRQGDLSGEENKQRRRLRKILNSAERTRDTLDQFIQVVDGTGTSHAAWLDVASGQPELVVAPLDVAGLIRDQLWSKGIPVVLTSGTLVGPEGFDSIIDSLGLPDDERVKGFCRPGSFDYANRVRIYIPDHLPSPKTRSQDSEEDSFTSAAKVEIGELLRFSGGRALCLFTSYRRLQATYTYLSTLGLPYKVLAQGQGNNGALLDEFRRDETSVLLATGAFWEGADVEGDALRLVIMDKLPFPNPQDPLIAAQTAEAIRKGEDAARTVYRPNMITMLRQGAGRLIRKESDWGVIAILDRRANRGYRRLLEKALPQAPWTADPDDVRRWFAAGGPNGTGQHGGPQDATG